MVELPQRPPSSTRLPCTRASRIRPSTQPRLVGLRTGPFERDEEALELGEVAVLVIADIGDVDIAGLRRDRGDVRRLVAVVPRRQRAGKALPRHAGEGGEPGVALAERAGGERRHRGGIEPAAEQRPDAVRAAHLPAHGAVETVAQAFRVSLIGRKPHRLDVGRRPEAALRDRAVGRRPASHAPAARGTHCGRRSLRDRRD